MKIIIEGRRGYKCKFRELRMTTKKAPSVELVNDDIMYKATTDRLRNQSSTALKRKREASVVHSK